MATPTSEIRKYFDDIVKRLKSPELMRKLGGFLIVTIRDRTRGKYQGVKQPGGRASQLKRVTPAYSLRRARMKGKHPQAGTGTRSNLTLTGSMLDGMILKRASGSELFIGFRKNIDAKKAEGQEKQGRRFLVLSSAEILAAKKFVSKIVADES